MADVVRPRARSPESGDTLLLEDLLEPHLGRAGAVCLRGGPGAGKTTALRYLRDRLPKGAMIVLLDDPPLEAVAEHRDRLLVVYAAPRALDVEHRAVLDLAPWGFDEALEFLQGSPRCAAALDLVRRHGLPEPAELAALWIARLREGRAGSVEAVLLDHLGRGVGRGWRRRLGAWALEHLDPECPPPPPWPRSFWTRLWLGRAPDLRLLRHRAVRMPLAAVELVRRLRRGDAPAGIPPADFLPSIGPRLAADPKALRRLRERKGPAAATLLFAADPHWRPGEERALRGGRFPEAVWIGQDLSGADLATADLRGACLSDSGLARARLIDANLSRALLRDASLVQVVAHDVVLQGADLTGAAAAEADFSRGDLREARFDQADLRKAWLIGADARRASFRGARLIEAMLRDAKLQGADLREADLTRARLPGADLRSCLFEGAVLTMAVLSHVRLDGLHWPKASLTRAVLHHADLTDAVLPGASLGGADLRWTRMAGVDLSGAELRYADLEGAQFGLGSSRSGKLFGEPSQGTRTGFYTDEYFEQSFRSPEEIRTADLRGCDLRGANVQGADFYLVDLRGARLDEDQRPYLRKTGAIL